ncbi:efflux RND transporter permease subunit [Fimbriiglobus ruber]|uniref:RND efflux system, inner membrane transporter CmeB n=1 Tax=Fimbriiglobus ruber TaxID=1908690 RepID=A0A225EGL3_9BACT|nr:efflux RND transporter permease subunit [Fimbriiglobus ruber]OWK47357.1 RND efflux system, inner membrane transporter CmeB [Fimbriiglobus ruber]
MFARFFIDRPIFATVLSLLVTLAGLVGYFRLPVALYPEITPPTVEVSAVYPGANAKDVVNTVAAPIEQQVNGVEGMMYMSSTSANDGTYTLTVTFKAGTDLNIAQVLVQNRASLADRVLPDIVRRRGVTVKKKSTGQLMIVNLKSPGGTRNDVYLSNYATIQLRDELARLDGVGDIQFLGQRDYSMRVWLDPNKLAARNLTALDTVNAIMAQNAQVAAGQIGQPPAPVGQTFQYTINTLGRLEDPTQFADIILKTDVDGRAVRMRDVAKVDLGAVGYDQVCTLDGKPSVALSIYQLPGTNALETAERVRKKMGDLRARFPDDVDYEIAYDTTPFIDESVSEVFVTLRDAVALVAIVMLVFLQSWRSAIIPLTAVPVAIIGTFGAMSMAGFSLNALTLFGLVLAVGIVVDDAIVVVEAVEHHIEHGLTPRDATVAAMNDVAGPVIAVGMVLAAVFIPCIFITGIVGQFFRQFAVTIAISTLLSAFNSLTLSPALCALMLKPRQGRVREPLPRITFPFAAAYAGYALARHFAPHLAPLTDWVRDNFPLAAPVLAGRVVPWVVPAGAAVLGFGIGWLLRIVLNRALGFSFWLFNWAFDKFTLGYIGIVHVVLWLTPLALVGYAGLVCLTYVVITSSPVGFIPNQDKGYLLVNVQLPDSASLSRTNNVVREVDRIARTLPGVKNTIAVAGQSQLLSANAPNFGTVYVMLEHFDHRVGPDMTADAIGERLQRECDTLTDAEIRVFGAPPVDGLGATGGVKIMVEDRGDPDPKLLQSTAEQVVKDGAEQPDLQNVFSGFRADTPWLELKFDREQAEATGVPVANVINDLQVLFGSLYVNDFNRFGRTWQVNVQADQHFREDVRDPQRMLVRTRDGRVVALAGFVQLRETTGPVMITRYNMYPAAAVTGKPAPGISSGQAIAKLEDVANGAMVADMKAEWTELALLQLQSGNTAMWAFILSVVLVLLVLAAQYESWVLPMAVILVVPMCLLCAASGVLFARQDVNIFTQVGFVVLIGLACKNAILIVEFARARHTAGASVRQATIDACRLRLRPIVMTSVAFILGVVPLIVAEGAGAEMRRLLGTAVFSGMIGVTLFGVFLTPVFFFSIQWVTEKLRGPETEAVAPGKKAHDAPPVAAHH